MATIEVLAARRLLAQRAVMATLKPYLSEKERKVLEHTAAESGAGSESSQSPLNAELLEALCRIVSAQQERIEQLEMSG